MSNEFNNSLGNFIRDFAAGGAIRHYCDLGFTVDEIVNTLDYPLPKEQVAKIVFQYYLDTGSVCLDKPVNVVEKARFIKEQTSLGKISMRRVVERVEVDTEDYIERDFGKQLYKNKYIDAGQYTKRMQAHIEALPWPLKNVWVKKALFEDL